MIINIYVTAHFLERRTIGHIFKGLKNLTFNINKEWNFTNGDTLTVRSIEKQGLKN